MLLPESSSSQKPGFAGILVSILPAIVFLSLGIYSLSNKDIFLSGKHGTVHFVGEQATIAGMWMIYTGLLFFAVPFRSLRYISVPAFVGLAFALGAFSAFLIFT